MQICQTFCVARITGNLLLFWLSLPIARIIIVHCLTWLEKPRSAEKCWRVVGHLRLWGRALEKLEWKQVLASGCWTVGVTLFCFISAFGLKIAERWVEQMQIPYFPVPDWAICPEVPPKCLVSCIKGFN